MSRQSTVGRSAPTQSLDGPVENAYQDSGSSPPTAQGRGNVSEANHLAPLRERLSAMARRRFQNPKPFREGNWWWINVWQDENKEGRFTRKRKRMKVCAASTPEREARKIANEILRPMNQGLQTIGSATCFEDYVENTYRPIVLPLLASTTKASYEGTLRKYLIPAFGAVPLREMSTLSLQRYFSELGDSTLSGDTVLKIKEVLSSVLGSAVGYELVTKNPMIAVRIPRNKVVNKKKKKPHLTPEEFDQLVNLVEEPYATMIYVAVHTGLRVSELVGLKWEDVHAEEGAEAITVDERYCRGDWSVTKTVASSTTIPVEADLLGADVRNAELTRAILCEANLSNADLSGADLTQADLRAANLAGTNLSGAKFADCNFHGAFMSGTVFGNTDLSGARGLETVYHTGPSIIGIDTIYRSKANIPESFLRGCGLPDGFITYIRSLVASPIEFYSCFISYSTQDEEFAVRIYADLQSKGVRCWFAPEDVQGGKKLHEQIDEAIRLHDKLLLILSTHSMASEWVRTEIANARKREVRDRRRVLFPIRLAPFETLRDWECFDADTGKDSAREIREYFIPDFSKWKNHNSYQEAFNRLVADLKVSDPSSLA